MDTSCFPFSGKMDVALCFKCQVLKQYLLTQFSCSVLVLVIYELCCNVWLWLKAVFFFLFFIPLCAGGGGNGGGGRKGVVTVVFTAA